MRRFARLMFVLPLVIATCAVAVLHGNVLCVAGDDHVAVEARHDGDCHHAAAEHPGEEHRPGSCSDVSADVEMSRAGDRSVANDPLAVETPQLWDCALLATAPVEPAASYLPRGTAAPPAGDPAAPLRTIVLII